MRCLSSTGYSRYYIWIIFSSFANLGPQDARDNISYPYWKRFQEPESVNHANKDNIIHGRFWEREGLPHPWLDGN